MSKKYRKLKGLMYENDVDQKTLAQELHRSIGYISTRMSSRMPFTINEVYDICAYLEIPLAEMAEYFPKNGGTL